MAANTRMTTEDIRQELTEWASHESCESKERVFLRARAELLHLSTRAAPKVKELEWVDASWKKNPEEKTINGCVEYRAYFRKGKLWGAYGSYSGSSGVYEIGQEFSSIDEAKAAAQTHFEKLILDQIEV